MYCYFNIQKNLEFCLHAYWISLSRKYSASSINCTQQHKLIECWQKQKLAVLSAQTETWYFVCFIEWIFLILFNFLSQTKDTVQSTGRNTQKPLAELVSEVLCSLNI